MAYRDRLHDSPPLLGHQQQNQSERAPRHSSKGVQTGGSKSKSRSNRSSSTGGRRVAFVKPLRSRRPGRKRRIRGCAGTQADAQMEALGSHLAVVPSSCGSVSLAL